MLFLHLFEQCLKVLVALHSQQHLVLSHYFNYSNMQWNLIMILICIYLIASDTEHFFMNYFPSFYLFGEVSVEIICPFLNGFVCFCNKFWEFYVGWNLSNLQHFLKISLQKAVSLIFFHYYAFFLLNSRLNRNSLSTCQPETCSYALHLYPLSLLALQLSFSFSFFFLSLIFFCIFKPSFCMIHFF